MPHQCYTRMSALLGNGGGLPPVQPNYLSVGFSTVIALIGLYFVFLGWQFRREKPKKQNPPETQSSVSSRSLFLSGIEKALPTWYVRDYGEHRGSLLNLGHSR